VIRIPSRRGRFAAYCALGWLTEVIFTGIHDYVRDRDPRLPARTHLYMGPICGLMQPLYEPLHDALVERDVPAPARAAAYAAGFLSVEYATGLALRRALGDAPWDYSYAEGRNVQGLIRPDYAPYWAAAGMAMERVHDRLAGRR
jgi:uncharacterized membrane protein